MGNDKAHMAEATALMAGAGADVVDINLGCPMPRVVRKGVGSAMLKNPALKRPGVACRMAPRSARSWLAMARPAASSAARLIRKPDERRPIDRLTAASVLARTRSVFIAAVLVLILTWSPP